MGFKTDTRLDPLTHNRVRLLPLSIFLLFCLFIVVTPSVSLIPWATLYDQKRIIQVALLLLPACLMLLSQRTSSQVLRQFLLLPHLGRWALALISFFGLLSSLLAPSPRHAFLELSTFILLIGFSLTVAAQVQRHGQVMMAALFIAIVAGAFTYQANFFTSYTGIVILGHALSLPEPFSGFSNIRFFNQYQIWTLPLISLPLLLYPRLLPTLRWLVLILASGWWVLLFASQSRGAQLAIGIALLVTLLIFQRDAWNLIKGNIVTGIVGLFIYFILFSYAPDLETASRLATLTEDTPRLTLWQMAIHMMADNPWLGVGPMHYAYYPNAIAAHPHNALLQIATEWGLPAFLILLTITFWGIISLPVRYFKVFDKDSESEEPVIWIGLFCSLVAGITYSVVSGVIVMPLSQTLFSAIAGLMLGLYYKHRTPPDPPTVQITLFRIGFATAAVGVVWPLVPDAIQIMHTGTPTPVENVQTFGPRYWQVGGITH